MNKFEQTEAMVQQAKDQMPADHRDIMLLLEQKFDTMESLGDIAIDEMTEMERAFLHGFIWGVAQASLKIARMIS